MTNDDELRRLFHDAEPAEPAADPDALVESLMARIESATGAADAGEAGDEAAAADATAPSRWRRLSLYGAAIVGTVLIAVTLYACGVGVGDDAEPLSSPSPTATPSVTPSATPSPSPSATPSPSASAVPTPTASPSATSEPEGDPAPPQPDPEPEREPPAAPEPEPEPEPAPPSDESAPRIRLTSAINDIWEVNDVCGPHTLAIRATIVDNVGVSSAGIRYVAGSASPAQHPLDRVAGDEFAGTMGPIEADSVAQSLQPTQVEVELWARDEAMNIATLRVSVPVRSAWACAPG